MYDGKTCEHEASHAVIATALGLQVHEIRVDRPGPDIGGRCRYRTTGLQQFEEAVVLAAPLLWIERFRADRYPDGDEYGSSYDQQKITHWIHNGNIADNIDEALIVRRAIEKRAMQLLDEHADDVLTIASRLQRHGVWQLGRGYARRRSA